MIFPLKGQERFFVVFTISLIQKVCFKNFTRITSCTVNFFFLLWIVLGSWTLVINRSFSQHLEHWIQSCFLVFVSSTYIGGTLVAGCEKEEMIQILISQFFFGKKHMSSPCPDTGLLLLSHCQTICSQTSFRHLKLSIIFRKCCMHMLIRNSIIKRY